MNFNNFSKKQLIEKILELENSLKDYKGSGERKSTQNGKSNLDSKDQDEYYKYNLIFQKINIAVALHEIVTDEHGIPVDFVFLDVNPSYEKTTKLKANDIIGKRGKEVIPNLEDKWIKLYGEVALGGKAVTVIDHSEYLDKYWEVNAFCPREKQFAVALTDVTEKIRADDQLKQNEERFRSIVNSSPIAIYVYELDEKDRLVFSGYNEAADKLLNIKHSGFIGKTLEEAFPPLAKTDIPEQYKKVAKQGESWYNEQVIYNHEGIKGIFEIYAFQLSLGKVAIMFNNISERKQAEEKLIFERNKAKKYLDVARVVIMALNLKGEITLMNQMGCEVLGYGCDELIHKNWFDSFIPSFLRKEVKEVFHKIIEGKEKPVEYYENPVIVKGGEIRIVAWHNIMLKDSSGKIIGTLSSGEDITEKKKEKKALEESEALYKATLYSIGDGLISTDVYGNIKHMNRIAEKITGWREADVKGEHVDKVFKIKDGITRQRIQDPVHKIISRGDVSKLAEQTLLISKSGKQIPILDNGAPIKNEQDEITGVVLVFRDQTDERLNKRLLEIRLSLIEFSLSNSLDDLLTKALDDVGALVNSPIGFYHFVEEDQKTLSLQQWSTKTLKEFCKTEEKGFHYDIDKAGVWADCVKKKKAVVHNDYKLLAHKKGLPEGHAEVMRELVVPVMRNDKIVAILGVGNKPVHYTKKDEEIVAYMADITWEIVKQKKAEEELIQKNKELVKAKEKAEESDRLKSAFLTNMSHEIRTPMNGIIGFSEMFRKPGLSEEKRNHFAKIVIESGKQLLTIVNDILDISMIETNTVKLISEEVNVNQLLNEIYSFFKPQFEKKKIDLSVLKELSDSKSIIKTDKNRIKQVLLNLINNAFKFTDNGYVKFGYTLKEENLVFFVEDTGIGIPLEFKNKIYERFRQVDMKATRQFGGTGLGLAISKKLVELMGGKLWFEERKENLINKNNTGTIFLFTIPYTLKTIKPQNMEKEYEKREEGNSYTILVAEDEEINFLFIEEILIGKNIKVLRAKDGKQAVELCKEFPEIDLVLMDIKMPVMNGIEATKIIKEFRPGLPVIAQTAYALSEDQKNIKQAGCDDYISKPIDMGKLIFLLDKYLEK